MHTRITPLTEFTRVVAAGQAGAFEQAVKAAYACGATHADLLAAVEIARDFGYVPDSVIAQAYLTVYYWSWMAARQAQRKQALLSRAA